MHFIDMICQSHINKQILIGGHRGHLSDIRENTVGNFKELARSEIRYIEIDIQLTRDNEAVIFHDKELSEKTPLSGYVRDHTVQELKSAFELNTLDEALCWCKDNRMFALLDRRTGKRTLEKLRSTVGDLPEWLQMIYYIRLEAEHMPLAAGLSDNTVRLYKATFRLLMRFLYEKKGKQRVGWVQEKYLGDNPPSSVIILMHSNSDKIETVKALPELIHFLRDWGYKFGVVTPMTPQPW